MEKTKFGISVALLSMLCYFTGYIDFTACIILFAVILVWSDSLVAKKNASQAVVLSAFFTLITIVLNWLSNAYIDIIYKLSDILNNWFDFYTVQEWLLKADIMGWLAGFVGFVECILMIIFVFMSLKGKNIKIPVVTKLVNKHFDEEV